MQARVALPLTWTVQAPQRAMPQPNLVPVIPSVSRRTQRRGICGSTLTDCRAPLSVKVVAMAVPLLDCHGHGGHVIFPGKLEFRFASVFVGEGVLELLDGGGR